MRRKGHNKKIPVELTLEFTYNACDLASKKDEEIEAFCEALRNNLEIELLKRSVVSSEDPIQMKNPLNYSKP